MAILGMFSWAASLPAQPNAPDITRPESMVAELGCTFCHEHPGLESSWRDLTPDLSQAGLRYQPSYLFAFLQNPTQVRHHLGAARMPGFHLTRAEALALTLFLGEQKRETQDLSQLPPDDRDLLARAPDDVSRENFEAIVENGGLSCLNCHRWQGRGGGVGVELADTGHRLRPDWMKRYLVDPSAYGVAPALMPRQFYAQSIGQNRAAAIVENPAETIQVIVNHLFRTGESARREQDERWTEARNEYAGVTAADGAALFRSLHCAACHRHGEIAAPERSPAPPLNELGRGRKLSWLTSYLSRPVAIRPFGYRPGRGNRMPDFRLKEAEARTLAGFLERLGSSEDAPDAVLAIEPLSAFSLRKAETLLTEKLSCLGCHGWKGQGGRLAPDLTEVRHRLTPERIEHIIRDPTRALPHAIMPRVPMTEATTRLITGLLLQTSASSTSAGYLSPLDHALLPAPAIAEPHASVRSARGNYMKYCAGCHGETGRGDGFNAAFLPTRPTAHADAVHMSARPDDTLFDGIHAGGFILNKSHHMPPWGQTLTVDEIRELVGYLRTLCECRGPAWAEEDH